MKRTAIIITILIFIITMGLFGLFKKDRKYISDKEVIANIEKQKGMNSMTLSQLSKYGVNDDSELKVEFFFYTNSADKASNLAIELKKLGYQIDKADNSASSEKEFAVTGWTTKIKMDSSSLTDWTTKMCNLGQEHDCEFDGWGTLPDQEIEIEEGLSAGEYYDKGLDFFNDNELRKSELYFSKSIELDSDFPISFYNRANVRSMLGNHDGAIEDYSKALELKSDYFEALENRGASKDDLGDYDGAIEDYSNSLKINPNSSNAYSNRGNSKYRKGDNKGACEDWKKALELGDKDAQDKIDQYCK